MMIQIKKWGWIMPDNYRFKVNLGGMIELLSDHLYSSPDVYVRELLQNGVDAIKGREKQNCGDQTKDTWKPRIIIEIEEGKRLVFTDNGQGLTEEDIHQFLSIIGESSKRGSIEAGVNDDYIKGSKEMVSIQRIKCGNGNCYIIKENGKAVLVDTARPKHRDKILSACRKVNIQLIILTHTHMDHSQNAAFISQELGVPIAICKADEELIKNNMLQPLYAKMWLGKLVLSLSEKAFHHDKIPVFTPTVYLEDGDSLQEFGINAKIIGLPGHTNGSIGIDIGKEGVLVGDALMNMVYPTVSMLYHDYEQMLESARKIRKLGERVVYFGHGTPKKNRIWVK